MSVKSCSPDNIKIIGASGVISQFKVARESYPTMRFIPNICYHGKKKAQQAIFDFDDSAIFV